jgi:membrane fusion protein (multidrug efflux system)
MPVTRYRTTVGLLALLALLPACKGKEANAEGTPADSSDTAEGSSSSKVTLPVVGAEVRKGDLVLSINTTGQVRSQGIANLKAETNGTVDRVFVQPGQRVTKGQRLVALDPRPFEITVREAEAAVAEARVRYVDYLVDFIPAGKTVDDAVIPEDRRQNARVRSQLASAEVRLEKAKLDRERATIEAPFNGVVDRVDVAPGERVGSGENIATVVDLGDLRVEASVLEHDLPLLRVGGDASVLTPAAGSVHGTITAVLPLVDSTSRAGKAIVRLPAAAAAQLRPGMYADVKLESSRLSDRMLVPTRAVIEREGRPLVFVVKNGRAEWVYVQPGLNNGTETEILPDSVSGLIPVQPGDTVLIEGHLTLTHQAPVRLVAKRE